MRRALQLLVLAPLCLAAQHGSSTVVNPYTTPADAASGFAVYRGRCAGCHGIDGAGTGSGPALNTGIFRSGRTDEDLFLTITKGIPGTPMPGFTLGGRVTWQLVTFLRSLAVSTRVSTGQGNADAGAKLFSAHCQGCHTVDGHGGVSGPDLTFIASRRSDLDLLESIARPNAAVPPEYWRFRVQTKSGETITGTRLNEDTHSVQLRDRNGRLISLRRADLTAVELIRESPMPAYETKLSEAEMDHIIAWLASRAKAGAR